MRNFKDWDGENWAGLFIIIFSFSALFLGIISLCFVLFTTKNINYCYITVDGSETQLYSVKGNIEWSENPILAKAKTLEEANELMIKICPVKGN